jgi:hypothetical protein
MEVSRLHYIRELQMQPLLHGVQHLDLAEQWAEKRY